MRGRDKLIGCAGRWGLGRDGFEISIALLPRSRGVRWASQFHTHLLSRNDSIQHPTWLPSPEAAVDKRMKQAKDPCCAIAAVEAGSAADWRGF
jgi:hypothetical protein